MSDFLLLIEPRNIFSLATVAVASNLAYLNLPAFGFRNEIVRHAKPIYEGMPKAQAVIENFWFKVLGYLAGLDNNRPPPQPDKHLNWDFLNTYNKWFAAQKDRRMMTGLLWYALSYIVLAAIQAVWVWKPEHQHLSGAMTCVTIVGSLTTAVITYKVGNPDDNAERPNLLMLVPFLTVLIFSLALIFGPSTWDVAKAPMGLYAVFGIIAYVFGIFALIICIVTPITMIRRGKAMVRNALVRVDFCNAQLIPIAAAVTQTMASNIMAQPVPPSKKSP